jgi:serine/threonine-protein kinase HipA
LPAWFENLVPEAGSALRSWICRAHNLRATDTPGLLRELGRDLPGAIEVSGEVDATDTDERAETIAVGRLRFSSLAGMQLKLSMLQSGARFVLPARGDVGRWLVKFPGRDYCELPEVETSTMAWARAAGLSVPDHRMLPIDSLQGLPAGLLDGLGDHAFAIERFDRRADGTRVHQEDFAQVFEIDPQLKYCNDGPRRTSYDGLARLVRDACGKQAQDEFIDRLAFVVAAGNGDAHLKNWAFQWGSEHRPRLSPCYDQVSTISWPSADGWGVQGGPRLALALGRKRRLAHLDIDRVRSFAHRANAPDGEARFLAALERIRGAWVTVVDGAPQRMRDALADHWSRVPLLRALGPLA